MLNAFDPASRLSAKRFLVSVAIMSYIAFFAAPQHASAVIAGLASAMSLMNGALGLLCRERVGGLSLNHWDESIAFMGLHYGALAFLR